MSKRILITACLALTSSVSLAQSVLQPRISFGPAGRVICEDYFKLLNQTKPKKPLQLCGSQIDELPGAKPVNWEVLDVPHNLELLHIIEWLLRNQINPKAAFEFKDWLTQFQRRAKNPASLPHIKQARVVIEPDQPSQLVYSYEEAGPACSAKKLANWKNRFGTLILFEDEIKKQGNDWGWKRGDPFIYGNRLHLFHAYPNDKTHFMQWTAVIETFDGKDFRRNGSSNYQPTLTCSFTDSEIFYPPPRR